MNSKAIYWLLRSLTLLGGGIALLGVVLCFVKPELVLKSSTVSDNQSAVALALKLLFYAIIYLVPYRYTLTKWPYRVRMGIFIMVSIKMLYLLAASVYFKHEYIFVEGSIYIILATIYPLSLYMKKQIENSAEVVNV